MESESVFKPKHHIDQLITTRVSRQIDLIVQRATQEEQTKAKVPGIYEMLEGEVRAQTNALDDVSENNPPEES